MGIQDVGERGDEDELDNRDADRPKEADSVEANGHVEVNGNGGKLEVLLELLGLKEEEG